MDAGKRLSDNGYEGVKYLTNYSYDSALIGVTHDGCAVYDYDLTYDGRTLSDYDLTVWWLMKNEGCTKIDAME